MIFQENPVKELLEYNNKFEGPILEGDEKFLWNFPERGDFFISEDIALSRIVNSNWALRNNSNLYFSLEALTALNKIYLAKEIYEKKHLKKHSLDNFLLANYNEEQYEKLNIFDLLMHATDSNHALRPHNRKFYFDKIYKSFDPIYYEGMPKFKNKNLILPSEYNNGQKMLLNYFENFNYEKFLKIINSEEIIISENKLKTKIDNVISNLKNIKFIKINKKKINALNSKYKKNKSIRY